MLQYNQLSAWIAVDDDTELEPYGIEISPDTNTVTCWIVSEAGKKFSVNWKDCSPSRQRDLEGVVRLDGQKCGQTVTRRTNPLHAKKSRVRLSPTLSRDIMFSDIQLTDDDAYLELSNANLGEVKLKLWHGTVTRKGVHKPRTEVTEVQKVHERTKKAGTHCVGFGEMVTTEPIRFSKFARSTTRPLATFIFKYRGYGAAIFPLLYTCRLSPMSFLAAYLDLLRANGIVPPPQAQNSVIASSTKNAPESAAESSQAKNEDDDDDTEREISTLKRKLESLESKRKNSNGDRDRAPQPRDRPIKRAKVKREHARKIFVPSGEVIDLT
ncbi:hypothetical protein BJ138DRAFT_1179600 [Hygrophoropsis aurantiaca]|uniref:Uncharacterized protein n=1 Tax=Hygrophoropsis aurantiaca TaxID=72124 RepID=A0ACB8ADU4_9AGAM|nr:hypothetical protein BJ138DRAFT_1179600 [Hygrophoropsis aurantiaca]